MAARPAPRQLPSTCGPGLHPGRQQALPLRGSRRLGCCYRKGVGQRPDSIGA